MASGEGSRVWWRESSSHLTTCLRWIKGVERGRSLFWAEERWCSGPSPGYAGFMWFCAGEPGSGVWWSQQLGSSGSLPQQLLPCTGNLHQWYDRQPLVPGELLFWHWFRNYTWFWSPKLGYCATCVTWKESYHGEWFFWMESARWQWVEWPLCPELTRRCPHGRERRIRANSGNRWVQASFQTSELSLPTSLYAQSWAE